MSQQETIQCPKCNSQKYVKNGFLNYKQRYKCKDGSCNYTTFIPRGYPKQLKNNKLYGNRLCNQIKNACWC
jgi:transposase-like protein